MGMLEMAIANLTSPVVLFFVLGIVMILTEAKVSLPSAVTDFILIYLLAAIRFKGGVAISEAGIGMPR